METKTTQENSEACAGLAAATGSPLWAVVLTICHEHGIGQFIANTTRPYRVPPDEAKRAHNVLGTLRNKVVVADKQTLMSNGFDLCEEDFDEPLELPMENSD